MDFMNLDKQQFNYSLMQTDKHNQLLINYLYSFLD